MHQYRIMNKVIHSNHLENVALQYGLSSANILIKYFEIKNYLTSWYNNNGRNSNLKMACNNKKNNINYNEKHI